MDARKQRRASYALREAMLALTPPVVVVAEDDAEIRRVVTMALRLDGYSVVEALDGAHLVEHIGSASLFGNVHGGLDPIGLVISDVRMSGKSGLDVLAQLRADEIRVGMILMTAYPDPTIRAQAERLGAAAFLPKPFEIDDLLGLVRGILTGRRTSASSAAPGRAAAAAEGHDPSRAPRAYHFRHM